MDWLKPLQTKIKKWILVSYINISFSFSYIFDDYIYIYQFEGMRPAMLLSTSLTALGTILKALPVSNSFSSW